MVELDLEKFFDRVNHDKLMSLLAMKIADKRTLKLLRSYLNSGIMEAGVVIPRTEGTPLGSPITVTFNVNGFIQSGVQWATFYNISIIANGTISVY